MVTKILTIKLVENFESNGFGSETHVLATIPIPQSRNKKCSTAHYNLRDLDRAHPIVKEQTESSILTSIHVDENVGYALNVKLEG